jgi:hypothetical protein
MPEVTQNPVLKELPMERNADGPEIPLYGQIITLVLLGQECDFASL